MDCDICRKDGACAQHPKYACGVRYGGPALVEPSFVETRDLVGNRLHRKLALLYDYNSDCFVWVWIAAFSNTPHHWKLSSHVAKNKTLTFWLQIARVLQDQQHVLAELELLCKDRHAIEERFPRHGSLQKRQ